MTWDSESWKRAAHDYHAARKATGWTLQVEIEPERLHRLRRLLRSRLSCERVYAELMRNRPTPKVVIEAVLHSVRERGLPALKEPANVERLARCDAAARAQINKQIQKLRGTP